jgi:PTH1 family peptidyl-tRNA hydrolase
MKLIVGLGNPGNKYENTRHSLGRSVVLALAEKLEVDDFKLDKKSKALILKTENLVLALPETFMNKSGQSVKILTTKYKIKPDDIIVVHDDIDIEFGELKISKNRGSAGHKGIQSVINHLKTKDFVRIRIGVRPKRKQRDLDKFVLKKFTKAENQVISKIIKKSAEAIQRILEEGIDKAMNEFNR